MSFEDDHWQVRAAAVEALAQIADKGNEGASAAVAARLEDDHWQVRAACWKRLHHRRHFAPGSGMALLALSSGLLAYLLVRNWAGQRIPRGTPCTAHAMHAPHARHCCMTSIRH